MIRMDDNLLESAFFINSVIVLTISVIICLVYVFKIIFLCYYYIITDIFINV